MPLLIERLRIWNWRRTYRPGQRVTRFIAPDVRREVEVLDVARIETGVIRVRTRTWNLLYSARGLSPKPDFGDARDVLISDLWSWPGETWGGPVPEGIDRAR